MLDLTMPIFFYNFAEYNKIRLRLNNEKKYQLHAIFRTQQGRQREPSIKTLPSLLSAEFWSDYV